MNRIIQIVVIGTLATRVGASIQSPVIELRLVSIVIGCLEVPTGAQVVMTDDNRAGYLQEPGKQKQVRWAVGMIGFRIDSGTYASVKAPSGDDIRYLAVSSNGKPGFVARVGMVEFAIDGSGDSDLQYLLSVARRLRTDVSRESCERPQVGKPAF